MSEVARIVMVVVCRNGTRFYIEQSRATIVEQELLSPTRPAYIKLDGCLIATNEISMVATPQKVDDLDKQRRGMWQCSHGKWQAKTETQCKCNWGMNTKPSEPLVPDRDPTPEEKERGRILRKILSSKRVDFRELKNLKQKTNADLKAIASSKGIKL